MANIISERTVSLCLMKSFDTDNNPFYAYLLIKEKDLKTLKGISADKVTKLPKNCLVICSDFGHEVSNETELKAIRTFRNFLIHSQK